MMKVTTLLMQLLLLFGLSKALISNSGKLFVQAFNPDSFGTRAFILSTELATCNVTISIFPNGSTYQVPVTADQAVYHVMELEKEDGLSGVLSGIRLEAECDFALVGLSLYSSPIYNNASDGWLAYPIEALGNEYLILGLELWNYSSALGVLIPNQLTIIAFNNGTTCNVTFPGRVLESISLNANDVYLNQTTVFDPTGTKVVCDNKVTVLVGQNCVKFPASCGACDFAVEQVPPVQTFGRDFILAPTGANCNSTPGCCDVTRFCQKCYEFYRVFAVENGTEIFRSGTETNESLVLQAGEANYILPLKTELSILTSTKPILLAHVMSGTKYTGLLGDPEFTYVPKTRSYLSKYQGVTCLQGFVNQYVNLIVPGGSSSQVAIAGAPVLEPTVPIQVPGTEFVFLRYQFNCTDRENVSFSIEHQQNQSFGMFAFGVGSWNSYAYWGGMLMGTDPYFCAPPQLNVSQPEINSTSCTLTRAKLPFETPTIWTDEKCCGSNGYNLTHEDVPVQFEAKVYRIVQRIWTLVDECGKSVSANQTLTIKKEKRPKRCATAQFLEATGIDGFD